MKKSLVLVAAFVIGPACSKDDSHAPDPSLASASAQAAASASAPAVPSSSASESAPAPAVASVPTPSRASASAVGVASASPPAHTSAPASAKPSAKGAPTCGDKPLPPCPLYAWMKANTSPAMSAEDFDALATALDKVTTFAPAGYTNWASIAKDGASAAHAQSLDGVKASCRGCHNQYKDKYKKEMRDRQI